MTVHLSRLGAGPAGLERSTRFKFEPIEKSGITDRPTDLFRLAQPHHLILSRSEQSGKVRITREYGFTHRDAIVDTTEMGLNPRLWPVHRPRHQAGAHRVQCDVP